MEFRWNEWNLDHATKHGMTPNECEAAIEAARPPYPEHASNDRWRVIGRGAGGRFVQVVYLVDPDGTFYVIHARPLTDREKRRLRRRSR